MGYSSTGSSPNELRSHVPEGLADDSPHVSHDLHSALHPPCPTQNEPNTCPTTPPHIGSTPHPATTPNSNTTPIRSPPCPNIHMGFTLPPRHTPNVTLG